MDRNGKMKIQYYDETDFSYHEIEVEDEFYDLSQKICHEFETTGRPNFVKGTGPGILLRKDKKTLCFCIDLGKERIDREIGTNLYRVSIQKVYSKEEIRDKKIELIQFQNNNEKK